MYTVYSKSNCPFCTKAKRFLIDNNIDFIEKDVTQPDIKKELLSIVPNAKTVPQILNGNGKPIGGYEELLKYLP